MKAQKLDLADVGLILILAAIFLTLVTWFGTV
jgi:hypothetical protein